MANISIAMPPAKKGYRKIAIGLLFIWMWLFMPSMTRSQETSPVMVDYSSITTGAERPDQYIPLLMGKNVVVVANHSSLIGTTHLVDALLSQGVRIIAIMSPEHGFRGDHADGALIKDGTDQKTGIPVISLYGKNKKPAAVDMENADVVLYDIQDVGVRFYTYISTMSLVMEACAEREVPFIVLDRPNPNGFYVDGPVLDTAYSSFVGMHPVPVVYGMTPGEYAQMVNGEGWLGDGLACDLTVVRLEGYERRMTFSLPVSPSPNLPNWKSVYLYPSLAFFEGTIISVGRGTEVPFQVYGHPEYMLGSYLFTPENIPGKSNDPPYTGVNCYGHSLMGLADNYMQNEIHLHLAPLLFMHDYFKDKEDFFTPYFDKLAGNDELRMMIIRGETQEAIRGSWKDDQQKFLEMRDKYLLY